LLLIRFRRIFQLINGGKALVIKATSSNLSKASGLHSYTLFRHGGTS